MAKNNGTAPAPKLILPETAAPAATDLPNEAEALCTELVLRVKRVEAALTALLDTPAPSARMDAKAILERDLFA